MTDLQRRLADLPAPLWDGSVTQCAVRLRGGRVLLQEPVDQARLRRRHALRRRLNKGLLAAGLVAAGVLAKGSPRRLLLGALGAGAGIGFLEGLATDLREPRPFDLAALDPAHGRVDLYLPDGSGLTLPLADVGMFLLVADPRSRRFHLGVVVQEVLYLPWINTRSPIAAASLTWLIGHLVDRPARQVVSTLPPPAEAVAAAEPIPAPFG